MFSATRSLKDRFLEYAGQLRFPRLLALTATLFALDLIFPDLLPFADEILLGLLTAMFGLIRKSRRERLAAREEKDRPRLAGETSLPR